MKRGLVIFLVLVVLLLGGAIAAPNFVDWNRFKDPIITQVENTTGYDVTIGGDLDMAVLPFPRVLINDLTVAVPGAAEPLLQMQTAEVNVALMPLFEKRLEITSVILKSPDVRLAIREDGSPGWMTPELQARMEGRPQQQEEAGTDSQLAIALNDVRITDGNFSFNDRRNDAAPVTLGDIDLEITAQSLSGPFAAQGGLRYGNTRVQVEARSARLDREAGNAPLQATVTLPEADTVMNFAGVVGLNDGAIEAQGETRLNSANVAQALLALTGKDNPALAKPLSLQGVVTYEDNSVAIRNMRAAWGGQNVTGALTVADLTARPLTADIKLAATDPVDVKALLPVSAGGASGGAGIAKAGTFLPASITLPLDVNGTAEINFSALDYGDIPARNVLLNVKKDGTVISWTASAEAFGGKGTEQGNLQFGAVSRAESTGAVTYSEPTVTFGATVENLDIEDALTPFTTAEQRKPLQPIINDKLAGNFAGTVTPRRITLQPNTVRVGNEVLTYNATYTLGAGDARPVLELGLGAEEFNAGRWLREPQQRGQAALNEAAAAARNKTAIADAARNFELPMDLHLTLALENVTMREALYDSVFFKGKVTGNSLEVENAGLRDEAQNSVSIVGTVGNVSALQDIDLNISGKTPDLHRLLRSFNVKTDALPAQIGATELVSAFKGQADNLSFVANIKAMQGTIESSGNLTNLLATPEVGGLTVRLRHPNYVDVVRVFNPNFSSSVAMRKSLDLFASMTRTGDIYEFTEVKATIGDVNAAGNISVNMAGSRPAIGGALQFGKLPVDELMGIQTGAKGTARANTGTIGNDVRWSRNALNTEWMWQFDLDMTATAASVSYGQWLIENADMAVTLKDGALNVKRLNGGFSGGTMALAASMTSANAARQPVTVNAAAEFNGVQLESLVSGFTGARVIRASGPVSTTLNVSSSGISPAALIFDLKGTGSATGSNLVFEGFDLARLSRTLAAPSSSGTENITNLLNATMKGGTTRFDNFATDIAISEGVVTFPKFRLEGPEAAVMLDGNVNLPLWTADLTSTIQLTEPADAPPLRVVFKGPLDNPAQTFGSGALQNYLQQMIGNKVQDLLINKLQKEGILPTAPQRDTPVSPDTRVTPDGVPGEGANAVQPETAPQQTQPQQPQQQRQAPATPEEALQGIMRNILRGN